MASDSRHSGTDDRSRKPRGRGRSVSDPLDRPMDRVAAISERMTKKAAKLERVAERHQQVAAKLAQKAEAFERSTEQLAALDVWTRKSPTARKPRFTREELAATAIAIADSEGFDAVSMRRIAAELDAGTMTLYHYIRTKDELLSLVVDAVMGELVVANTDAFASDWRAAMQTIAELSRAALLRHPWILDITDDPPVGPNSVRHFDQSMQAVASLPITLREKLDIVSAVDAYVFGFCLHERNQQRDGDPFEENMISYVNELIETGDYPQLAALTEEHGVEGTWTELDRYFRDPTRFERGLARLLDGFAASLTDAT
jgi:AcrR family transcriptional regulator